MSAEILPPIELDRLLSAYRLARETSLPVDEAQFLAQLDASDQEKLRQYSGDRSCETGEVIMREGEPGDCMYIIRAGRVAIMKGDRSQPMLLSFRGEGSLIGEMALLENQPRSATAVALEPTSLWTISQASFLQLWSSSPAFGLKILDLLSSRLRQSDEQYRQLFEHGIQRDKDLDGMRDQAMRDHLTGLYNRRSLEATLAQKISQPGRQGAEGGILMVDVDHFKQVNDTYGHPAGDAVLQALARRLAKCVRAEDIVCRYGGEEFVVVMPGAPLPVIQERAELIRQSFSEAPVHYQGVDICATLSIGAAMYPLHGINGETVLACADKALYQAKQSGRNQVIIWQGEGSSPEQSGPAEETA